MNDTTTQLASLQFNPATPVAMYTSTSARCWCGATIMLRTDGYWTHGAVVGLYCPEPRGVVVFEPAPEIETTVPCFDCGYAVRLTDGAWTDTDGGTECRGFGSPHYATQR